MIWQDTQMVAFDFETSGILPAYALQPWRIPKGETWATSLSVIRYQDGKLARTPWCGLWPKAPEMRGFLEAAIANDWTVIAWNGVFDLMVLIGYGCMDLIFKVRWLDGMLLWRHLEIEPEYEFQTARHKKKSYRLKPEGHERWLPSRLGRHEDVDFHSQDPASMAKLQAYNDDDSVDTWLIAKMIWRELTPQQQEVARIEAECMPLVAQANYHGMVVDPLVCKEIGARELANAEIKLALLAPHGITEKVVRSPLQLSDLMFNAPNHPEKPGWGLPVLKLNKSKTTGKETRSTDKEVLHELAFKDQRAAEVKAYREALNTKAKFCDSIIESVEYHGDLRTRPNSFIFGTYSGRFTVGSKQGKGKDEQPIGWALHQMKRDKTIREMVIAPEGYTILEVDAAGQEYRWMACASGDVTMLGMCEPGEDPHSFMGSRIVGCDYQQLIKEFAAEDKMAVQNRYLGKFANLSLQYRTGVKKLRVKARVDYNIPLEMPEAHRIHTTYKTTYPGVPAYWERQIEQTKRTGYVETFAGRRVQVVGDWDGEYGWAMGSTSLNYRIQGTGADQKYLALAVLKPYLTQIGAYFVFDLHDGLFFYVPTAVLDKAVVVIKTALDNLPYLKAWGYVPPVPMPWDVATGPSWGKMKGYRFK